MCHPLRKVNLIPTKSGEEMGFLYSQYRAVKCRAVFLSAGKLTSSGHFGFLDAEHHTKQPREHLRTLDHNNFHSLLSSHSFKSSIPTTISATAIMNSKHFAENIARQIAAPTNAHAASITPIPQPSLRGLLGRRIPFTSLSDYLILFRSKKMVTVLRKYLKKHLFNPK